MSNSLYEDSPPSWQTAATGGNVRGIPWWAAVLLALAFTGIGVFADLERVNRLGLIFQGCYFVGCVLAVLWVQRRGLFGPMVQPPLILALAVPGVVLAASGASTGDSLTAKALAVGTPLINGFPTMAITTGATVLIGLLRMASQRPPKPELPQRLALPAGRPASGARAAGGRADGARTSADYPRRSTPRR